MNMQLSAKEAVYRLGPEMNNCTDHRKPRRLTVRLVDKKLNYWAAANSQTN